MKRQWLFGASFALALPVWADAFDDAFGGGARSAHMDALGTFSVEDAFSATANPAWALGTSGVALATNVLKPSLGSRADESSAATELLVEGRRALILGTVGMAASLPVGPAALIDTGDASKQLPLWTGRVRTFSFEPYMAFTSLSSWRFGLSVPVKFQVDSTSEIHEIDGEAFGRVRAGLRPIASYKLGIAWEPTEQSLLSIAYAEEHEASTVYEVHAEVPLLPTLDPVEVQAIGEALNAYSPRRLTLQGAWHASASLSFGALVRYSQWSGWSSPFVRVNDSSPSFVTEAPSLDPKDTVDAGVAFEKTFSKFALQGAYRYQPSPVSRKAPGYYDRAQHIVGVGGAWVSPNGGEIVSASLRVHALQGGGLYTGLGFGLGSTL